MNRQNDTDQIGAVIRSRREAIPMSPTLLAGLADINLRTLERIEAGEVKPQRSTRRVIELALDKAEAEREQRSQAAAA